MAGVVAAGPTWVVVSPFSSVEREKMTWPLGCWGVGAGVWAGGGAGTVAGVDWAAADRAATDRKMAARNSFSVQGLKPPLSFSANFGTTEVVPLCTKVVQFRTSRVMIDFKNRGLSVSLAWTRRLCRGEQRRLRCDQ